MVARWQMDRVCDAALRHQLLVRIFMTSPDGSVPPINLSYGLGGPSPQWTRDGKSIVFVRYYADNGYSRIGMLQADIPVSRPSDALSDRARHSNEGDPQPSPDGKWLAFTAARSERPGGAPVNGIWIVPIAGGEPRLLFEAGDSPQWSADSGRVAFVTSRGAKARNIGVVDIETRESKLLTHDDWDDGNPRWSPDGRTVAFVANRRSNFYMMTVPSSGGAARQLTDRPGVSGGFEASNARGTFRWAPDGRSIVYTFMDHARPSDLWRVPAAGGTPRQLTNRFPDGLRSHEFVAPVCIIVQVDGRPRNLGVPVSSRRIFAAIESTPLLLYPPFIRRRRHVRQRLLSVHPVLRSRAGSLCSRRRTRNAAISAASKSMTSSPGSATSNREVSSTAIRW